MKIRGNIFFFETKSMNNWLSETRWRRDGLALYAIVFSSFFFPVKKIIISKSKTRNDVVYQTSPVRSDFNTSKRRIKARARAWEYLSALQHNVLILIKRTKKINLNSENNVPFNFFISRPAQNHSSHEEMLTNKKIVNMNRQISISFSII